MKKALITLTLLAAAACAYAEVKVATVDMAKLFDGYNRAKAAQSAMESEIQKAGNEAQRRQNEGRQMLEQMDALRQKYSNEALSKDAREAAKKQARDLEDKIEAKKNEFERFQMETRKALVQKETAQREKIYDEIQNAAIAVARKQGANVILNVSEKTAAGLPVVVYSDKSWDITNAVLSTLNASGGAAPAAAPAPASPAPKAKAGK